MLITLSNGANVKILDLDSMQVIPGTFRLAKHSLRYHIVNPDTRLAEEQFHTTDTDLQDKILTTTRSIFGREFRDNIWISEVLSRKELWDASDYRRMVQKDLERYFGDDAVVTATSVKKVYYVSDGNMSTTPDAIGMRKKHPLIYKGYAVATIFDIDGRNPLSPKENIVYWLTRPMWEGFHNKYRRVPKDYPYPTGFAFTKWCQRDGNTSYGNGIWLASMTQGQTVGSWAATTLRQFWIQKQGRDIFPDFGEVYNNIDINHRAESGLQDAIKLITLSSIAPYGKVGACCASCGKTLQKPFSVCKSCGFSNNIYDLYGWSNVYCVYCGRSEFLCKCGSSYGHKFMGNNALKEQEVYYKKGWGK